MSDSNNNSITATLKQELPENPESKPRKVRSDKGKSKKTAKLDVEDVKLQFSFILIGFSKVLAQKNPRWSMSEEEAKNIEMALDLWLKCRLPMLEKFYPELVLFSAIGNYAGRVILETNVDRIEQEKRKKVQSNDRQDETKK